MNFFWFTFSGHTKIRHQSHSAFWEPCIFGITYRIITEARWEAVTHITKAWLPLQVFHPILRQRENSTLSFGGGFFWVMFLANQQEVTPEGNGTHWGEADPSPNPGVGSRASVWVSQSFKCPGHHSAGLSLFLTAKILHLTNLLHENVARGKFSEQTTSFYSAALSFPNKERILRISRGIFITGSSGGPLC